MLVDTGASVSLITQGFFAKNCSDKMLQPSNINLCTADCGRMAVYGKFTAEIEIGFITVSHDFLVTEMDFDIIIGLDFLQLHSTLLIFNILVCKFNRLTS